MLRYSIFRSIRNLKIYDNNHEELLFVMKIPCLAMLDCGMTVVYGLTALCHVIPTAGRNLFDIFQLSSMLLSQL